MFPFIDRPRESLTKLLSQPTRYVGLRRQHLDVCKEDMFWKI
jgi:hypothetical protein